MPALRAFGRRWHVASDDLPVFAAAGAFFHLVWGAFLAAALGVDSCSTRQLKGYFATLLGCDALLASCFCALFYVGLQGSILDVRERASAPIWLNVGSVAYVLLLGASIYGSVSLAYLECTTSKVPGWDNITFGITAFAFHWAAVACFFAASIVTFNMHPDLSDPESWRAQCMCYGRLCCLGEVRRSFMSQSKRLFKRTVGSSARLFSGGGGRARPLDAPRQQPSPMQQQQTAHVDIEQPSPLYTYQPLNGSEEAAAGVGVVVVASGEARGASAAEPEGASIARLEQMASLFHMLMSHVDLTPSDYATGLVLLGILQRCKRERERERARHAPGARSGQQQQATATAAAVPPPSPPLRPSQVGLLAPSPPDHVTKDSDPTSNGEATSDDTVSDPGARSPLVAISAVAAATPSDVPSISVLEDAVFYFRHATGIYGWPMHLYANRTKPSQCCCVCCGCCTCCKPRVYRQGSAKLDAFNVRKNLTIEAIKLATGMNVGTDLLYCSLFNAAEGLLPYYVAIERSRHEVVISVRGSMSQYDMLTDFLCFPVRVDSAWIAAPGQKDKQRLQEEEEVGAGPVHEVLAHKGVLSCAYAIADDLHSRGVLRAVLDCDAEARARLREEVYQQDCRGWRLVVVGHSLGAGVAALLSQHLRTLYPGLHCWAYAPPGGLLSPAAAHAMRPYCTSVVIGKDMIPRLTLGSMQRLTKGMLMSAARCKVSKTRLWFQTLVMGKQWKEEELFKPEDQLNEDARLAVQRLEEGVERSVPEQGLGRARDFCPPGALLYYEKAPKQARPSGVPSFEARWMSHKELADHGLIVSKRMFLMHIPDFQAKALKQTLESRRRGG